MSEYRDYYHNDNPFSLTPIVKGLMILYCVVFFVQGFLFFGSKIDIGRIFGMNPQLIIEKLWIWQIVTYIFLHNVDSIINLFFTLITLYFFGPEIERYIGRNRFIVFYLLAGVFGAIVGLLLYPFYPEFIPIIDPAPALYGLLCFYACIHPHRTVLFMFVFPIKIKYLMTIMLVVYGWSFFVSHRMAAVCLLGGALFGYLFYKYEPKFQRYFERLEDNHNQSEVVAESQMRQKVDDLLEKISREGIGKLTRKEKNFLKKASKQFKDNG